MSDIWQKWQSQWSSSPWDAAATSIRGIVDDAKDLECWWWVYHHAPALANFSSSTYKPGQEGFAEMKCSLKKSWSNARELQQCWLGAGSLHHQPHDLLFKRAVPGRVQQPFQKRHASMGTWQ